MSETETTTTEVATQANGVSAGGGVEPAAAPTPMAGQEAAPPPADPLAKEKADIAARFEQAKQYELKQRAAKRQVESERARLAELEQQLKERGSKYEPMEQEWKLFQENPLEWAEKRNVDPDLMAERILRPTTPEQRKIAEIEKKIAEKEAKEKEFALQRERVRQQAERQQSVRELVQTLNPDDHPSVTSVYEPWEIQTVVDHELNRPIEVDGEQSSVLQHFIDSNGRLPTVSEVADFLEERTKARISKYKPPATATPAAASASGASEQAPSGVTAHASPNGRTDTLTNTHAAEVASGRVTPGKSLEERRAELLKQLAAEDGSNPAFNR